MPGPLEGIRVIDLTSVVLGPLATQIFGDLGADVIKIEAPEGDATRYTGPARSHGMAAIFLGLNRNKRSVVLDLKRPSATAALWRLVEGADVFVHSIRPQAIARLGFGPDSVTERNPRIVYAALHGYGAAGPYAGQPAYDDVIQGQAGSADLMARLTGEPRYMPTIIADKTCGLVSAYAVMAALVHRERTGRGQLVEVPMLETMTAFNMVEHLYGHSFVPPEGPMGYPRVLASARRPYPTADGHIAMLAYTDAQWRRFWSEVDRPDLAEDPRFGSLARRGENIAELYRLASECLAGRTTAEWVATFRRLEIPAAPVAGLEDLASDPHLAAVGFFREADHPSEGRIVLPGSPVGFADSPAALRRLQPRLGEHSLEVLREAGLSEEDIRAMLDDGATRDGGLAGETA